MYTPPSSPYLLRFFCVSLLFSAVSCPALLFLIPSHISLAILNPPSQLQHQRKYNFVPLFLTLFLLSFLVNLHLHLPISHTIQVTSSIYVLTHEYIQSTPHLLLFSHLYYSCLSLSLPLPLKSQTQYKRKCIQSLSFPLLYSQHSRSQAERIVPCF